MHFIALLVLLAGPQIKHAPTTEQCQADHHLWFAQVENEKEQPDVTVLDNWLSEMDDCEKVDPTNKRQYQNLEYEILVTEAGRMISFLDRHHLHAQFVAEDKQGHR
jgi:hypothetical protein